VTGDSLDARFARYMTQRFGRSLAAIEPGEGPGDVRGAFVDAMRTGMAQVEAGRAREAETSFLKVQELLPDVPAAGGASWGRWSP
jgi:hypothetical protein